MIIFSNTRTQQNFRCPKELIQKRTAFSAIKDLTPLAKISGSL